MDDGVQLKAGSSDKSKDELRYLRLPLFRPQGLPLTPFRRVRNRLSQRAIRERRAIRIQQLEQDLAQIHKSSGTRFDDLRAENEKLRNGLHATRKKLLSISTTTSSVADTIRALLDLEPTKNEPDDDAEPLEPETPKENRPINSTQSLESPSTEEIIVEQQNGLYELFPEQYGSTFDLNAMAIKTAIFPTLGTKKQTHILGSPEPWTDETILEQITRLAPTPGALTQQVETSSFDEILPSDGAMMLSSKRSISNFSDHLDHIFKLLRLSGIDSHFTTAPLLVHSLLHSFIQNCWPVMDHWFTVTNSCTFMTRVMWWQTTKSAQSFIDMPGGYTPTPSQLILSYPCIIDWIPHHTIRNAMVANYDSYDVDQVICDMTDAYVVDEHTNPLNVMEMVKRYSSPTEDTRMVQPYENANSSHLHPQSDFLQAHRIHRFKIDPSFFVKYPGLYDATAIARTPCSSIQIHNRAEANHRPLPFSVRSANAYLDMTVQAKSNGFR